MDSCQLCRAIEEHPPHCLYQDDIVTVMLDRKPLSFGHCMIVPTVHVTKIYEVGAQDYTHISLLARRLATHLEKATESSSVAYLAFGSGLPHAHLHLVPHCNPEVVVEPLKHVRFLTSTELREDAVKLNHLLPKAWWQQGEHE